MRFLCTLLLDSHARHSINVHFIWAFIRANKMKNPSENEKESEAWVWVWVIILRKTEADTIQIAWKIAAQTIYSGTITFRNNYVPVVSFMLIKSRPRQWMCISIITYSISKGKHHLVLRVLLYETCDLCVCKRPERNMIWLLSVLFDRCVHCCKHLQLTIKTIK